MVRFTFADMSGVLGTTAALPNNGSFYKIEKLERKDEIGRIIRKWPGGLGHGFQRTEAQLKSKGVTVTADMARKIGSLEVSALGAFFAFSEGDGRKSLKLLFSDKVLDTFPKVSRLDFKNMERLLNVFNITKACDAATDAVFLGFVADLNIVQREAVLTAAVNYGEKGVANMSKKEFRDIFPGNTLEDWSVYSLTAFARAFSATGAEALVSTDFIARASTLSERTRALMLNEMNSGIDMEKATSERAISMARRNEDVKPETFRMLFNTAMKQRIPLRS
jgi:hypothetical protein